MQTKKRKPPIISAGAVSEQKTSQGKTKAIFESKALGDDVVVALEESSENEQSNLTS